MSATAWVHPQRLRGSAISPASVSAIPNRRSITPSSRTPPSEVRRPPSNAAVSFLWPMAGKPNGKTVSSGMAGVALRDCGVGSVDTRIMHAINVLRYIRQSKISVVMNKTVDGFSTGT